MKMAKKLRHLKNAKLVPETAGIRTTNAKRVVVNRLQSQKTLKAIHKKMTTTIRMILMRKTPIHLMSLLTDRFQSLENFLEQEH